MNDDIFNGCGVEIKLDNPEAFLKIKETLTRIGIASSKNKELYQTCHILHKRGRYVILHFKELFILDGKINTMENEDIARRNTIAKLLEEWGLLTLVDQIDQESNSLNHIKVISFRDKQTWKLIPKYNIGVRSDN